MPKLLPLALGNIELSHVCVLKMNWSAVGLLRGDPIKHWKFCGSLILRSACRGTVWHGQIIPWAGGTCWPVFSRPERRGSVAVAFNAFKVQGVDGRLPFPRKLFGTSLALLRRNAGVFLNRQRPGRERRKADPGLAQDVEFLIGAEHGVCFSTSPALCAGQQKF
jgi:hypothetical protein